MLFQPLTVRTPDTQKKYIGNARFREKPYAARRSSTRFPSAIIVFGRQLEANTDTNWCDANTLRLLAWIARAVVPRERILRTPRHMIEWRSRATYVHLNGEEKPVLRQNAGSFAHWSCDAAGCRRGRISVRSRAFSARSWRSGCDAPRRDRPPGAACGSMPTSRPAGSRRSPLLRRRPGSPSP